MTIEGMDVVQVRTLAGDLGRAGDRLRGADAGVTDAVAGAWWHGRDADDFRASWRGRSETLRHAAAVLGDLRAALLRQVAAQEATSADVVPAAAGAPAASLFGPFEDLVDEVGERAGEAGRWLEWLVGPHGPSIEDATARVPHLQQALGDAMDAVMRSPLAGPITEHLGFQYVPGQDFYTTNEHSVQSRLGFHDAYDTVHKLFGMDLDDEVVRFEAHGVEYRLELWKGGYGSGGAFGGEIGLYTRRPDETGWRGLLQRIPGYSSTAQGADQIEMSQTIYDRRTGEVYFTNAGAGTTDGDHFWNLAIRTDPGVRHEDLGQQGTLHVPDPDVRAALAAAMREQGMEPDVDDVAGTVSYAWE